MWMNFAQDATAKIEGLLAVNRGFLQDEDDGKDTAQRTAELCGIALRPDAADIAACKEQE